MTDDDAPAAARTPDDAPAAVQTPDLDYSAIKSPKRRKRVIAAHTLLFLAGCCIAATCLWAVEKPREQKARRRAKRQEKDIYGALDAIIADYEAQNNTAMLAVATTLRGDVHDGCDLGVEPQYYWSFAGALYFVATVVTTIGYGTFTPQTAAGKAMTSYAAIVGVAWFGFILSIMSDRVLQLVALVDRAMRCKAGSKAVSGPQEVFLQAAAWNLAYVLLLSVLGSWWLGLTYGNAAYMAVITFTTVGLGDFAPPFFNGPDTSYSYIVGQYMCFAVMSLFGLVLLALLIQALDLLVQEALESGVEHIVLSRGAARRAAAARESAGPSMDVDGQVVLAQVATLDEAEACEASSGE